MLKPLRFPIGLFAFLAGSLLWFQFLGCAEQPVKMKCAEIRARLDMQNLSEDQKRFAEQEYKECVQQLVEAHIHDSTTMDKLEKRFTPEDSL